jgi:hypothetical protein
VGGEPPRGGRRAGLLAALLAVAPVGAAFCVAAVAAGARAHAEVALVLAAFPVAALIVAPRRRAWGAVIAAVLELGLVFLLHAYLTLVRAARLEGG